MINSLLRSFRWLSVFALGFLASCGGGGDAQPGSTAASSATSSMADDQALPSGEYPAPLIGRYADRECAEAKMIEEAAGLWPGFEIKQYERIEQALTCAPLAVSRSGSGYTISEQCLVAGVGQQVTRESVYQLSDGVMSVTFDGATNEFQRCVP